MTEKEVSMMPPKLTQWIEFSTVMMGHIQNYAIPQYGPDIADSPDVQCLDDCFKFMSKYHRRAGSNRRGRIEELRDLLKIAHFAQYAFDFMEPTPEELEALAEGRTMK